MRATPPWRSPSARAAALGFAHLLVDAVCVTAVYRTGGSTLVRGLNPFGVVLGYNLLAFATQAPLGMLLDRFDRFGLARAFAAAGLVLSAFGLFLAPYSTIATLFAAGIGNSLFHLGAGANVLRSCEARTTPAGIYVAPGALGLGLGIWMGQTGIGPSWPLIAMAIMVLPLVDSVMCSDLTSPAPISINGDGGASKVPAPFMALALIFLSIMIRSYIGFGAARECERGTTLLLFGIPFAAFVGKATGGVLADRLGWIAISVGGLLLSAPLIAFNCGNTPMVLVGLLLFQMTMPVTLVATSRLLPGRPATAFGVPSLALILGALPTFYQWGRYYRAEVFLVLILISAASLFLALRLLGVRDEAAAATSAQ